MMKKKESILQEKSEAFMARIIKLYQYLINEKHETTIAKQIYRSGTSIGANVAESKSAQSGLDFIHKLSIALKEANETEFWLKSLYAGNYINEAGFTSLRDDNEQLIKMLVSSIKTMKKQIWH
jgi:four helix bundle protein